MDLEVDSKDYRTGEDLGACQTECSPHDATSAGGFALSGYPFSILRVLFRVSLSNIQYFGWKTERSPVTRRSSGLNVVDLFFQFLGFVGFWYG